MEKGEEDPCGGKDSHDMVETMPKQAKFPDLRQLPVLEDIGDELDAQHHEIGCDAEGHLNQHGMDIGMPEDKPPPERLADIYAQHDNCSRIADESDDHGGIEDILQFLFSHYIDKKTGKKCPGTEGNYRQVEYDPEGKGKDITHVGLIQPFIQTKKGR
jgi:hypothetical protein